MCKMRRVGSTYRFTLASFLKRGKHTEEDENVVD
jgi:hypothetical protein